MARPRTPAASPPATRATTRATPSPSTSATPAWPAKPARKRAAPRALSRDEWADAALYALAAGGLDAVAVEPLARSLGVTKGSFYWHFKDRDALLHAALMRWEQVGTEAVITRLDALPDPAERLRHLFVLALSDDRGVAIEVAVSAAAHHPKVSGVLARVSRRRLEYVVDLYRALDVPAREARLRGTLAYAAYVGLLYVVRATPDAFPTAAARRTYAQHMIDTLVPASRT